jgi:hypothetical protein
MADVTYSAPALTQLGRDMTDLSSSVRDEPGMPDLDVTHLARAEVVSALQTFESDWATQRRALASRLEASGELASRAATTFTEADRLLAEAALTEAEQ